MGHKVNPIGLRLGINRNWESRWFPAKGRAAEFIAEDYKIRKFLKKELYFAGVSSIIIERTVKKLRFIILIEFKDYCLTVSLRQWFLSGHRLSAMLLLCFYKSVCEVSNCDLIKL